MKNKFLIVYLGGMIFVITGLVISNAALTVTAFFITMIAFIGWNILRRRQRPQQV